MKRVWGWLYRISRKRLNLDDSLENYTQVADWQVAKFARRFELTDAEMAWLLKREAQLDGLAFHVPPGSHLETTLREADKVSIEGLQHKYARLMLDSLAEKVELSVTIHPETDIAGRVAHVVATYFAVSRIPQKQCLQ